MRCYKIDKDILETEWHQPFVTLAFSLKIADIEKLVNLTDHHHECCLICFFVCLFLYKLRLVTEQTCLSEFFYLLKFHKAGGSGHPVFTMKKKMRESFLIIYFFYRCF